MKSHCRVCLNIKKNKTLFPKELTLGTRAEFEYIVCNKCRSLSICEVPKNLEEYYKKYPSLEGNPKCLRGLKKLLYKNSILREHQLSKFALKFDQSYDSYKLKSLFPLNISSHDKILDVGCGKGELIQSLSLIGCKNLTGIDPFLKEKKILLGNGVIQRANFFELSKSYDLIMFHHSFGNPPNK